MPGDRRHRDPDGSATGGVAVGQHVKVVLHLALVDGGEGGVVRRLATQPSAIDLVGVGVPRGVTRWL